MRSYVENVPFGEFPENGMLNQNYPIEGEHPKNGMFGS